MVDARGPSPALRILIRGEDAFEPAAERDGCQASGVLSESVRSQRHGFVDYRFETQKAE